MTYFPDGRQRPQAASTAAAPAATIGSSARHPDNSGTTSNSSISVRIDPPRKIEHYHSQRAPSVGKSQRVSA